MAKQAAEEERRRRKPFENRKQALLESHPAGFELQTEAHRVRSISPYRRRGSRQTPLFTRWRVLSFTGQLLVSGQLLAGRRHDLRHGAWFASCARCSQPAASEPRSGTVTKRLVGFIITVFTIVSWQPVLYAVGFGGFGDNVH